jgi:hypothetical protein
VKIVCCYNYPTANFGPQHADYAEHFVTSYRNNPPHKDHQMIVVSNGGKPDARAIEQFSSIGGAMFLSRDNVGMDIGAYQFAALRIPCDLMVFFGGSSYFRRPGWLRRMMGAYNCYGDGLYGCSGNQGDIRVNVWPHVRTTGFWCNPKLLNEHPFKVTDNSQRYPWEHSENSITQFAISKGLPAYIVGWDCVLPLHNCDSMAGGFHQGTQHNIIVGDRLTSPPYWPSP